MALKGAWLAAFNPAGNGFCQFGVAADPMLFEPGRHTHEEVDELTSSDG